LKRHFVVKISPNPSLPKRGNSSLWKREVGRDFERFISNGEIGTKFGIRNQSSKVAPVLAEVTSSAYRLR